MTLTRWKTSMGFQAKVLVPVLAILVLLLGGTLWLVHRHIREEFRTTATRNLATANVVLKNSRDIRSKSLILRFRSVPNEPRFKAVSQLGDPSTLRVLFAELLNEYDADVVTFTSQDGVVLASISRIPRFKAKEFDAASVPVIEKCAAEGQPTSDLVSVNSRIFDAVSVPSMVNGRVIGVLTFGVEMDERVVHEFKQMTRSEIVLLTKGRATVSTLIVTLPQEVLTGPTPGVLVNEASRAGGVREMVLGGEHFLTAAGRLDTLDREQHLGYLLLSSYEHKLRVLHSTERWIGGLGLGVIALSAIVLWRLIRKLTRPLRQLRDAAERIGAGDLSQRVEVSARDECGELARVFNQMTGNLQESHKQLEKAHAELERRVHERTAALAASEERFRAVAENLGDGLVLADLEEVILDVNPSLLQMAGYTREEMIGRKVHDLLNTPDQAEEIRRHSTALADGRIATYEILMRRRNDTRFWAEITWAPVHDARRSIFGTVGVVRDVTGRKEAEARLEEAHRRLMDASRQAGMAEIATGVLHNVGNVLNSVNVSAGVMARALHDSKVSTLARTVALIGEHEDRLGEYLTNDPKGRKLPGFLRGLADHLATEQTAVARELRDLQQYIDHIKQIVATQQSFAKVSGVLEPVSLRSLVDDALQMAVTASQREQIDVVRELSDIPPVMTDRHKVLQILVNLIRNAQQALDSRTEGRCLTLRVAPIQSGRVRIEVADNGEGIPSENLTRIFQHGFTTKKSGHGFGLHSGANAAREMGGTLAARSDGHGKGATFILELPVAGVAAIGEEAARAA